MMVSSIKIYYDQTYKYTRICSKSYLRESAKWSATISKGVFPLLSLASLLAPFSKRALTGLVVFNTSTLLTARCRGVNPY
jgi:hypothetical protein